MFIWDAGTAKSRKWLLDTYIIEMLHQNCKHLVIRCFGCSHNDGYEEFCIWNMIGLVQWMSANVIEENTAAIFSVKGLTKLQIIMKQTASRPHCMWKPQNLYSVGGKFKWVSAPIGFHWRTEKTIRKQDTTLEKVLFVQLMHLLITVISLPVS